MALPIIYDRVKDTTTTTGTGTVTLANVAPTGFRTFGTAAGANVDVYYLIQNSTGSEHEVGIGTYTHIGTTLSRTTVLESSNAGALVNFSAGTKDVVCVAPADLLSITTKGDLYTASASRPARLAIGTNTQVLTADSAEVTGMKWATPAGGTAYFTWNTSASTAISATVNNAYVLTHTALQTVTLPTTAAVGDRIKLVGVGSGKWKIAQNASELIRFGNGLVTTTGTGGFIQSLDQNAAVELVCVVANNEWEVIQSDGNITSDGSYIASQMPSLDLIVSCNMDNSVRWQSAGLGGGSVVFGDFGGLEVKTSATAGGRARSSFHAYGSYNFFTGSADFSCVAQVPTEGTNYQSFFGLGRPTTDATGLTMTDRHIGFEIDRSAGTTTLYATCADGTTQTRTAITTFTAATDQIYQFVKDGTTAVRFYLDGVYKTTITANIPTITPISLFGVCVSNRNTASQSIVNVSTMHYRRRGNQ